MKQSIFSVALVLFSFVLVAQTKTNPKNQNEELGKVSWFRDYDEALLQAKKEGKAVLILFQEVPGCSTCRNYGHNVLTHPMMVEGIENLFVPLAIFNNKGGKDKEVLEKYNEPTWNNPVVRIVNSEGKDLVDRVAGNYSTKGLYNSMIEALKTQEKEVPNYFKLYGQEINATGSIKEKTYQMYCFWTGEKYLGQKEGVLQAESGFAGGAEVVKVKYDASILKEADLTAYAENGDNSISSASNFRFSEKDHLYYLKHSEFKYLPLTNLQKTKINSALGLKQNGEKYLSPKQLKWLKANNSDIFYLKDIKDIWDKLDV